MPFERLNLGSKTRLFGEVVKVAAKSNPGKGKGENALNNRTMVTFILSPEIALRMGVKESKTVDLQVFVGTGVDAGQLLIERAQKPTDTTIKAGIKKAGVIQFSSERITGVKTEGVSMGRKTVEHWFDEQAGTPSGVYLKLPAEILKAKPAAKPAKK